MTGWANSLSAGEIDSSLEYGFFMIAIELTDIGQGMPSLFWRFQPILSLNDLGSLGFLLTLYRGYRSHGRGSEPHVSIHTSVATAGCC